MGLHETFACRVYCSLLACGFCQPNPEPTNSGLVSLGRQAQRFKGLRYSVPWHVSTDDHVNTSCMGIIHNQVEGLSRLVVSCTYMSKEKKLLV